MSAKDLETLLGNPYDDANPVGYRAVLDADERREMSAEGEKLLDAWCLNAEFVPAAYGGRFTRADRLAGILRTLWRRDAALGSGYGFASFLASVNVWTAGTADQRGSVADRLLANQRVAAAFHELDHGNDIAHTGCAASPAVSGWSLSGRKEVVANVRRAETLVVFARTGPDAGRRSHSQFLLARDAVPAERVRDLPRVGTSGMRGLQLGGIEFADCPIPADAVIGDPGQGMEIALRAYQVTRAVLPAMALGSLDTALRTALDFAAERRLYGAAVSELPYVRAVIARAHADLLAVEAFSGVVVRGLHLVPESMAAYAAAAKYLTSRMVLDAVEDLRSVLGASGYLRQGPYAIFQKVARDAAPATFVHISRTACLITLLPQLPRLARKSWLTGPPAAPELFDLGADLPSLDFDALVAAMARTDGLLGALVETAELGDGGLAARFAVRFRDELRVLRDECIALAPGDLTSGAGPAAFDLADRYTVLLAAACVLAVWRRGGPRYPDDLLPGVLDRLAARLRGPALLTAGEREQAEYALFAAAGRRHGEHQLFDPTAQATPGGGKDTP
ncbi:acyl-CoA dehydrogenase [Streptomyces sp. NBC_01235]|uniref:acyl-CoA dehydrogenase n=1 Tax=Streptomyces sp. NBC_01235 TaxID=2903788 RepID=UPI002E162897|nr:acyl-CoA dehydrogenase [Streptomyces sp. NBC_01235]